ncbi:exonuclease V-like [Haliotis rufescens]|uniref:exonuclease V-like n=1 Tax=Haliotis rufescens TaxID=6454 RepID=UPI00201E7E30|nr:exonuclease V-like [Haliotis rufescens]
MKFMICVVVNCIQGRTIFKMEAGAGDSESAPAEPAENIYDSQDLWSDEDDALLVASSDTHACEEILSKASKAAEITKVPDSEHDDPQTSSRDSGCTVQVKRLPWAERNPLQKFRPGYLWVSDLTRQHWCEQMMLYTFTVPTIPVESPVMTAGSNLHLARELAVHSVVQVKVTSSEDIWATKVINLFMTIQGFLNGINVAREIPIFGAPFDKDVFIVGLIDELRFDPDSYTIDLLELKTRSVRSCPKIAQQNQNKLQVMLYKKLFDDLVKGRVSKETVAKHLRLDLEKPFGEDIMGHLDSKFLTAKNLNELLDFVFIRIQSLTCISQLSIEYVLQDTNESLSQNPVEYDDNELKATFEHLLQFWQGQREVEGVEIEDSWKCQRCDFADVCEWRERKAQEHSHKNTAKAKLRKKMQVSVENNLL